MSNRQDSTITLIRHGRVNVPKSPRLSAGEMRRYVQAYNSASIVPPGAHIGLSSKHPTFDMMLTSTLPRSIESARYLNFTNTQADPLFCEAELPTFQTIALLKLPQSIWLILMRLLWTLGRGQSCESRIAFQTRMSFATQKLIDLQAHNTHIALMGHGVVNYTLSKKLKEFGYSVIDQSAPHKHWGFTRLQRA